MITVYVGGWNRDFSNLIMTHIHMPASEDAIKHALHDIGVDIENGGDYRIRSFFSEYENIRQCLKTTDDIWELNALARQISKLDELDRQKLDAACVLRKCNGAIDVMGLAAKLDRYEYLPAGDNEELGALELESGRCNIPESMMDYIDCYRLGRDVRLKQGGAFVGIGYIYEIRDEAVEHNSVRDEPVYESEDDEWER